MNATHIKHLIEKLDAKSRQINQQVAQEKDNRRRRRMEIELQVLSAQKNKGLKLLHDL